MLSALLHLPVLYLAVNAIDSAFEKAASYEEIARHARFYYSNDEGTGKLDKTVFVAIFIRNKEHSLPFFLKAIEDLDYDKKRMRIWIVCDHTRDESVEQIESWIAAVSDQYMKVESELRKGAWHYPKQKSDLTWTEDRYLRMLELRQMAVIKAREYWADYICFIDADNILMNPYSLRHLIDKNKMVISPMLDTVSAYSNFWGGMNEKGYYIRSDNYFQIRRREVNGTFPVPMVHSTFLIDLRQRKSKDIQFLPLRDDYKYDFDDIIVFAGHCQAAGVQLYIDNTVFYGYMPVPMNDDFTLEDDIDRFIHLRMEVLTEPPVGVGIEMKKSQYVSEKKISPRLDFDKVYVINLKRRGDRRTRMRKVLQMQGIEFTMFEAVDSKNLNSSYLREFGIEMMPGYVDPHRERGLTRGEIGCFLSHFSIWSEVIERQYQSVMVLEDDIRFEPGFVRRLMDLMQNIKAVGLEWDLLYIGRKRLKNVYEPEISEVDGLVEADYSYWTLGYVLSLSGAEKLVDGNPLPRMVPVDEYLPIMYDKHPISAYKDHFQKRNLIALSANPLLIFPTHYTNEVNYFSDTETSAIWEEDSYQKPWMDDGQPSTAKEEL